MTAIRICKAHFEKLSTLEVGVFFDLLLTNKITYQNECYEVEQVRLGSPITQAPGGNAKGNV